MDVIGRERERKRRGYGNRRQEAIEQNKTGEVGLPLVKDGDSKP